MSEIPKEVPFSPKPEMQNPPEKKAEPAPPPIPPEAVHPDTEAIHSQKRVIDLRSISFEVDPMVAHKIQMQMQDNQRFAQTIHTNITKLFYDYLIYKVRMRENLNLAIKGETRSGKSTVGLSFGHFISSITRVPYGAYHICANESEYYSKVKNAKFSELYHIDEQKESKFGSGCLPRGSEVLTKGGWSKIEQVTKDTLVITFNTSSSEYEYSCCYPQRYKNPYKFNMKITLRNGQNIITTPNHEWLIRKPTGYEYRSAKHLSIGDVVEVKNRPLQTGNSNVPHTFARILGFITGDGHLSKRHYSQKWGTHNRVQFTNSDHGVIKRYKSDIKKFFRKQVNWITFEHEHVVEGYKGRAIQHYFHDKQLYEAINQHIPNENKSSIVRIPTIIKQANSQTQREFLKAYFSCDGTVSEKGWKNQNYHIAISTVSKNMADDLMMILTDLGFTPYLNTHSAPPMKDGYIRKKRYWVSIFRRDELLKFSKEIGFYGQKSLRLHKALGELTKTVHNHNNWSVDTGVQPFMIKNIRRIRTCKNVFDIETPHNHNYVCRNAVLHNSFREEMSILDIQNIIAKQCVHTIWIYPSDFIARNSVYGLETYGKDLKNKLIRCIVYDIRRTVMGMSTPLGYVIIPKVQDPHYQNLGEPMWSKYRLDNKYKLKRMDFDSQLEEDYEKKKDEWIEREKGREGAGFHHEERFKLGVWLGKQKQFTVLEKKAERRALARQVFRDLTEAEVDEIVVIADMGINPEDIEKLSKKKAIDARKEVDG